MLPPSLRLMELKAECGEKLQAAMFKEINERGIPSPLNFFTMSQEASERIAKTIFDTGDSTSAEGVTRMCEAEALRLLGRETGTPDTEESAAEGLNKDSVEGKRFQEAIYGVIDATMARWGPRTGFDPVDLTARAVDAARGRLFQQRRDHPEYDFEAVLEFCKKAAEDVMDGVLERADPIPAEEPVPIASRTISEVPETKPVETVSKMHLRRAAFAKPEPDYSDSDEEPAPIASRTISEVTEPPRRTRTMSEAPARSLSHLPTETIDANPGQHGFKGRWHLPDRLL
jgi:hypothetical protein